MSADIKQRMSRDFVFMSRADVGVVGSIVGGRSFFWSMVGGRSNVEGRSIFMSRADIPLAGRH
jgi:hypothetical protein